MRSPTKTTVDGVIESEGLAEAVRIKHVASLLFTYRCTISCKHCLFNSSPSQPPVRTSLKDSLQFLRQLHATYRVVHIAGAEPMMYHDELLKIWRAADGQGLSPHFLETNASWCVADDLTRKCFEELCDAGAKGILISCDPCHLAYVPPRFFQRARRIAYEVFGHGNVIAGTASLAETERFVEIGRDQNLLGEYVRKHPPRLVGRAGEELAGFLPDRPIEELGCDGLWHGGASKDESYRSEFDPEEMCEIHIDPYGNIQTNCGIILGNARQTPLPDLMGTGFGDNELAEIAYEKGPTGLLETAVEYGYRAKEEYPQKCNLCWEVRKYLRAYFPDILGPDEIYGRPDRP